MPGFATRLGVLLAFMAVSAAVDRARHGAAATRWREYLALLAAGALGAVFGLACDQVTSRLSPGYFVLGKGLDAGPGFAAAVVALSLEAGFVGGAVLGGALLVANGSPPLARPLGEVARLALLPLVGALACAAPGGLLARAFDPLHLEREVGEELDRPARARFVLVWGVHAGVYAGGLAGTALAVARLRRRRQA